MTYTDLPKEYVDLYNRVAVWVVGDKTVKAKYGESKPSGINASSGTVTSGGTLTAATFVGTSNQTINLPSGPPGYSYAYSTGSGITVSSRGSGITSSELMWGPVQVKEMSFKYALTHTWEVVLPVWQQWWKVNDYAVPEPLQKRYKHLQGEYKKYRNRGKPSTLIAEAVAEQKKGKPSTLIADTLNAVNSSRRSP